MSASGIFPNDDWALAQGHTPEGTMILRFRTGNPSEADRELFNKLIMVRWAYDQQDTSGLPSSDVIDLMDEFEERVLDASDEARWSGSCVAVVAHNGVREWRFYTPDTSTFQTEFSKALGGMGPYPLDLQVFDDPDWTALGEIRENVS